MRRLPTGQKLEIARNNVIAFPIQIEHNPRNKHITNGIAQKGDRKKANEGRQSNEANVQGDAEGATDKKELPIKSHARRGNFTMGYLSAWIPNNGLRIKGDCPNNTKRANAEVA